MVTTNIALAAAAAVMSLATLTTSAPAPLVLPPPIISTCDPNNPSCPNNEPCQSFYRYPDGPDKPILYGICKTDGPPHIDIKRGTAVDARQAPVRCSTAWGSPPCPDGKTCKSTVPPVLMGADTVGLPESVKAALYSGVCQ